MFSPRRGRPDPQMELKVKYSHQLIFPWKAVNAKEPANNHGKRSELATPRLPAYL